MPSFFRPGRKRSCCLRRNTRKTNRPHQTCRARHHSQDQPGEEGMVEIGDAAPFQPLRLAASCPRSCLVLFRCDHSLSSHCSVQCAERAGSMHVAAAC